MSSGHTARPITAEEVIKLKTPRKPDAVIDTFNKMIQDNWNMDTMQAVIEHDDACERLAAATGCPVGDVHSLGYLDVKEVYESADWEVELRGADDDGCPAQIIFSRQPKS